MNSLSFSESIEKLLKISESFNNEPSLGDYLSAEENIRQILNSTPLKQKIRISILSTFSIRPLDLCLILECAKLGFILEVYVGNYNQVFQETYSPDSGLNKFQPHAVFYFCEYDRLISHKENSSIENSEIEELSNKILGLQEKLREFQNSFFIFSNFIVPIDFPYSNLSSTGLNKSLQKFNQNLIETFQNLENSCIFDLENLAQFYGKGNVTHPLLKFSSDLRFSEGFMVEVGKKMSILIKAFKSNAKKCLVLDCDNTLWGGVVGEKGIDGIGLSDNGPGSEFYELQKRIKSLYNRGVILALNSKNNLSDVLEVLQNHPHMLLNEKHFASIQVNWENKADNMIAISKDLNIGLDSIVFLDDDPIQRKLIQDLIPEVKVIELPKNPTAYFQIVQTLSDFEIIKLTAEDKNRGLNYAAQKERKQSASKFKSFDEYLISLKTVIEIGVPNSQEITRLSQLCQKTNQFNLSTKRYTESDLNDFLNAPDKKLFSIKSKDIFGNDGIVGLSIITVENSNEWELDTFLLSCRILGRNIEDAFLDSILKKGIKSSAILIKADYLPTSKNSQIKTFFERWNFQKSAELEHKIEFHLTLDSYKGRTISGIQIIEN